jgi:hypothetical protein
MLQLVRFCFLFCVPVSSLFLSFYSQINCTLSEGAGKNLIFRVQVGAQVSRDSVDTVSYPTPVILSYSVRGKPTDQCGASSYTGPTATAVVTFDVLHLPSSANLVSRIDMAQPGDPPLPGDCSEVKVFNSSSDYNCTLSPYQHVKTVQCKVPNGAGNLYRFTLRAINAISAPSNDTW